MGALHHSFWSLLDTREAHLGVVGRVEEDSRTFELLVARSWTRPVPAAPLTLQTRLHLALDVLRHGPPPPSAAEPKWFTLTPPVEWTDPHQHPVQHGLAGGRRHVTSGVAVVVAVGFTTEALDAGAFTLDTLALAFDPAVRAAYPARPVESLIHDLATPDRRHIARAALSARGPLPAGEIVAHHSAGALRGLIPELRLDPGALAAFAFDAAAMVPSLPPGDRGERATVLVDQLGYVAPGTEDVARAYGALAAALDPKVKGDAAVLQSLFYVVGAAAQREPDRRLPGVGQLLVRCIGLVDPNDEARRTAVDLLSRLPDDERDEVRAALGSPADFPRARRRLVEALLTADLRVGTTPA